MADERSNRSRSTSAAVPVAEGGKRVRPPERTPRPPDAPAASGLTQPAAAHTTKTPRPQAAGMDAATLRDEWDANQHRPQWIRDNRERLMAAVDVSDPIPRSSVREIRDWKRRYASTVTKQLNEAADGGGDESE